MESGTICQAFTWPPRCHSRRLCRCPSWCRYLQPSDLPLVSLSPLETSFSWVLSGVIHHECPQQHDVSYLSSLLNGDDRLQKVWEVESCNLQPPPLSLDDKAVIDHFYASHHRNGTVKFIVPLLIKVDAGHLGESRSLAVQRFLSLDH